MGSPEALYLYTSEINRGKARTSSVFYIGGILVFIFMLKRGYEGGNGIRLIYDGKETVMAGLCRPLPASADPGKHSIMGSIVSVRAGNAE